MTEGVAFQTRARTIDHLGRGQIADAPTAVSELWKNAYDAYARNVALHICDGKPEIAGIFDDGVGMSYEDVVRRWLVIGTESKIEEFDAAPPDTLGLPIRERQGEKGIGRLSVAFLAPCTVLVSRKRDGDYVVVGVDWRLFENPFISLDEIRLPVEQFSSADELVAGLPKLLETLRDNLGQSGGDDRQRRLHEGWERFSAYERRQGIMLSTADMISASWRTMSLGQRHLQEWPVFLGHADQGTAMFMLELNHELGVWVHSDESGEEVAEVKDRLRQTLTGFIDPYSNCRPEFDYEVFIHRSEMDDRIISAGDVFGIDGLHDLEHYIEGEFDDRKPSRAGSSRSGKTSGLRPMCRSDRLRNADAIAWAASSSRSELTRWTKDDRPTAKRSMPTLTPSLISSRALPYIATIFASCLTDVRMPTSSAWRRDAARTQDVSFGRTGAASDASG